MIDDMRKAFESSVAIPNGVYWNAPLQCYCGEDALESTRQWVFEYQAGWNAWQAACQWRDSQASAVQVPDGWREALEKMKKHARVDLQSNSTKHGRGYLDAVSDMEGTLNIYAAMQSLAQPAQNSAVWIPCSERMPTADEYDVHGRVWAGFPDEESCIEYANEREIEHMADKWGDTYWMPTGLTKPEPPAASEREE